VSDFELQDQRSKVQSYYRRTESLIGYKYLMGETKHFGYYDPGERGIPFGPALRRMEGLLASRLRVGEGERVLDAGSGMGVVACEVAGLTGASVTGIDILDFNVGRATARSHELGVSDLVSFEEMDYSELSFPENYFDAVYTCETLVHAIDPGRVLSEFYRVLKPSGRVVMLEYSRTPANAMPDQANRAFEKINALAAMPAFQNVFLHGALADLLRMQGFEEIREEDLTPNIMPMLRTFNRVARVPLEIVRLMGKEEKAVNAMSAVEFYRYRDFFKYILIEGVKPPVS
jgi:sterol 24-C-methyltransferase